MTKTEAQIATLKEAIAVNDVAMETLKSDVELSREDIKRLKDETRKLSVDQMLYVQQLSNVQERIHDQHKQLEKWDNRFWGIVVILVTGFLGLIVAMLRKTS